MYLTDIHIIVQECVAIYGHSKLLGKKLYLYKYIDPTCYKQL